MYFNKFWKYIFKSYSHSAVLTIFLTYWLHWLQFKDNNPSEKILLAVERLRKLPVDCCNFMAFAATFANTIAWGVEGIHSRDTNYMSRAKSFFVFISFNLGRILANINTYISDNYLLHSTCINDFLSNRSRFFKKWHN